MADMRRDFATRAELIAYLKAEFPHAAEVCDVVPPSPIGGRKAAKERLRVVNLEKYEATRNFLDGEVTRLSPYIRYGVLSLAEVRDYALANTKSRSEVEKFISELGWRDYFQRVYAEIGDGIWEDIEEYKTGFSAHEYATELPEDIRAGQTGVTFIDDQIRTLYTTGYLHNHARMWLAAYVVHWRRVRWQAGAAWFLEHLLDGDPASNNLSWQWVASTFSSKPYYYNLDNVLKYTGDRYRGDPAAMGHQAFVGSYETIARRLFPRIQIETNTADQPRRGR